MEGGWCAEGAKGRIVFAVSRVLVGLNFSTVGTPLRSLLRVVVFTSRPASEFPSAVIELLLVVFPCISDVQDDAVCNPARGLLVGGLGSSCEDAGSSLDVKRSGVRLGPSAVCGSK